MQAHRYLYYCYLCITDYPDDYWSGYFTSHPAFKRYIRASSGFFHASSALHALLSGDSSVVEEQLFPLWHALGVVQVRSLCYLSKLLAPRLHNWNIQIFCLRRLYLSNTFHPLYCYIPSNWIVAMLPHLIPFYNLFLPLITLMQIRRGMYAHLFKKKQLSVIHFPVALISQFIILLRTLGIYM